ncbi:MAG: type II toxin-antitoxin system PemK/MazF family toxin [candidate division KSB1 bacterium]|nr:type II toxin-antitoxin system PemK/MazF family toxin [candidate division KSB1 bacterium]
MNYKRGDVISIVYRPPTKRPQRMTKSRPMVVISSNVYHTERPQDVIAALVTSKIGKYQGSTDYKLNDWTAAGLHAPSVVRCKFATIEQNQIGGKIGSLSDLDILV